MDQCYTAHLNAVKQAVEDAQTELEALRWVKEWLPEDLLFSLLKLEQGMEYNRNEEEFEFNVAGLTQVEQDVLEYALNEESFPFLYAVNF